MSLDTELQILPRPSPNFSNRTIDPRFIILHCIGYDDPLRVLREYGASAHYVIPVQNDTQTTIAYQLVFDRDGLPLRAWHAGTSAWLNYTGLNDYSIGIEINVPNYAFALTNPDDLNFMYFDIYQKMQMHALVSLVHKLQAQYNIPSRNIISHSDISPWRISGSEIVQGKTDPGPTLPWECLAKNGVGVWPDDTVYEGELNAIDAQRLLGQVGYNVPTTGEFDTETNLSLSAFSNLHFFSTCNASAPCIAKDSAKFLPVIAGRLQALSDGRYIAVTNDQSCFDELSASSTNFIKSALFFGLMGGGGLLFVVAAILLYKKYYRTSRSLDGPDESEVSSNIPFIPLSNSSVNF